MREFQIWASSYGRARLAEELKVSIDTIHSWCSCRKSPRYELLKKLSKLSGLTVEQIKDSIHPSQKFANFSPQTVQRVKKALIRAGKMGGRR